MSQILVGTAANDGTGDPIRTAFQKVNQSMQDAFNVKYYGAKGDGATDDTVAIQSAFTAAAATSPASDGVAGCVFFPTGFYQITATINVLGTVRVIGTGARNSMLRAPSDFPTTGTDNVNSYMMRIGAGTAPVFGTTIEQLGFECGSHANGIFSSDLQNGEFRHVLVNQYGVTGATQYGIRFDGSVGSFGSCNSNRISETEVYKGANGGNGTGFGISLENGSFPHLLTNVAVASTAGNTYAAGIRNVNCPFQGVTLACDIAGTDGVQINAGPVQIVGLAANVQTTAVRIAAAVASVSISNVIAFGAGTNTLVDAGNQHTPALTITIAQCNTLAHYQRVGNTTPSIGFLPLLDGLQMCGPVITSRPAPAWSASITPNALDGENFFIGISSNIAATINAPNNGPTSGYSQRIRFVCLNSTGGTYTQAITFSASYKASATVVPAANGTCITVDFTYDSATGLWREASRSLAV